MSPQISSPPAIQPNSTSFFLGTPPPALLCTTHQCPAGEPPRTEPLFHPVLGAAARPSGPAMWAGRQEGWNSRLVVLPTAQPSDYAPEPAA